MSSAGFDSTEFARCLERAHAHADRFLQELAHRHVGARAEPAELLAALRAPLHADGEDAADVLDALAALAQRGATACAGPRYFGFVVGGAYPVALATDWLVSAWDQNAGIHAISPLAAAAETVAGEWLLELLGLPTDASVGFVTGCQQANFACLAAARHALLQRAGWDVEADGLRGAPQIHIVTSAEAHVTVDATLRYLGFGTRAVHRVESDAQGRMRPKRLRDTLQSLAGPSIVCAQAGNVNTGAFDPLREIGEAARAAGAWLHVDGAFGLWARASRRHRDAADGAELADSWATDAHKWLNVPYDCGVAIVRQRQHHRNALMSSAPYLVQAAGEARDAMDWVPEFSRRARGVPVYATLRTLGGEGVEALVDRCCALARQFAELLGAAPDVRILNDVVLNQVLVRFGDSDALTREVIARVQADGTCWLGGTVWHGMAAMRISVSNWATTETDVARSADAVLRMLGAAQAAGADSH